MEKRIKIVVLMNVNILRRKEKTDKNISNGEYGEIIADRILKKFFNKIEYIGFPFDYLCNNILIEIKTTQYTTKKLIIFRLHEKQHYDLIKNDGIYLFIIFKYRPRKILFRLINPNDIEFEKNICFKKMFLKKLQ